MSRIFKLVPLCAAVALLTSAPAYADIAFSGSGNSGNLVAGGEPWAFNFSGNNNWGSPGVGASITPYKGAVTAFGFDIAFTGGGTILPGSIELGNASACAGSAGGGTTFCSTPFTASDIWIAFQTGPSSIAFRAQNASFNLNPDENYFVNVFFTGETPTAFTGRWVTDFSPTVSAVPEPETYAMLLAGLGVLGFMGKRRRAGLNAPAP